jgi:ABC-2 type transport system permease protein
VNHYGRALKWSAWLGWQIESNWTTPWLFAAYVLVKPLAGSFLVVCMYWAAKSASGGATPADFLPYLYVSSACFMVVAGVTSGMSNSVVTDRESYKMLKYMRISPIPLSSYLIGRGLSRAGQSALGGLLTLGVGWLIFADLRVALGDHEIVWWWLLLNIAIGIVMLIAIGLMLAGTVLNMARYGYFLAEGIAGMLYLLCGAVFPVNILPPWLQPLSRALPPTYWLESMRRVLLGQPSKHSVLPGWSQGELFLLSAAATSALVVAAYFYFRWCERRAWLLGMYEESSGN